MSMRSIVLWLLVQAVLLAMSASKAVAGPPLLCHEIQIGDAASVPWGKDVFDKAGGYDASRVVDDTLALLDEKLPVLARMETIRRAALYIERDIAKADRLLGTLLARTLDAEVVMDVRVVSLRYFDAGYLAATLQQAGVNVSFQPERSAHDLHRVPGYAWMVRGYKLADLDGDMALALALVTADTRLSEHTLFLERAVRATAVGDSAREDLLGWISTIRGTTLDALRTKFAADAGNDR